VTKDLRSSRSAKARTASRCSSRTSGRPTKEINAFIKKYVTVDDLQGKYADVFKGDANWQQDQDPRGETYAWDDNSTYVQNPPYFVGMKQDRQPITDIVGARILGLFGDKITTDHISPAGSIKAASPAGKYLSEHRCRRPTSTSTARAAATMK
jgi:aconitate hydratase